MIEFSHILRILTFIQVQNKKYKKKQEVTSHPQEIPKTNVVSLAFLLTTSHLNKTSYLYYMLKGEI